MSADKKREPVRPQPGRVPGFGQRPPHNPDTCPTCGAKPPCDPPSDLTDDERRTYQSLTSRGTPDCDAVAAALDGVHVDDVRATARRER